MATLKDVVAYICENYPYKDELSKARLTKLVYLADWKMSIDQGRQITPTRWYFNHYGPYVYDIEQLARSDGAFEIVRTSNQYGSLKEIVRLREESAVDLTPEEREAIDFAMEKTKVLSWDGFIKLIYSTYPIVTESRYDFLDLPVLADEYRTSFEQQGQRKPVMG